QLISARGVAILPALNDVGHLHIQQPLVADRRRIAASEEFVFGEVVLRGRFVRDGGRELLPDSILMLAEERDLVPRTDLPRHASVETLMDQRRKAPSAEIRLVCPFGRVACVLVLVEAGDVCLRRLPPPRRTETPISLA